MEKSDYYTVDTAVTEGTGIEGISEQELMKEFHDATNDEYGYVQVLGQEFGVADVLKEMDPTAYRVQFFSWLDMEEREDAVFTTYEDALAYALDN